MGGMRHLTDPAMFKRFDELLTKNRPGYKPWYFLLTKLNKDPADDPTDPTGERKIAWKKNPKHHLSAEQAIKYMRGGANIGIAATGMDGLCIIDIDDIEATPDSVMKPTLSVRSRKRIGRHYFYWTQDPRCKSNIPTDDKGEIRANWQYVVAPGSFVLCSNEERDRMPTDQREFAGKYTIENEAPVSDIEWKEVPPVFKEQDDKNKNAIRVQQKKRKEKAKERKKKKEKAPSSKDSRIWHLAIDDIMDIPDKSRFPSFFHSSETGKNTSVTDTGGIACWRHLVTHTPMSALAVLAGVTDCLSAGVGMADSKAGDSEIDYKDGKTLFKMWDFAKRESIISQDDPIPPRALTWYATEQKIVPEWAVVDGWKLPPTIHNAAIEELEKAGTPSGRKPLNVQKMDTERPAKKGLPSSELFISINDRGKPAFEPVLFANWLYDHSGEYFITFRDTDEIFYYKGGVYSQFGDKKIGEMLQEIMQGKLISTHAVNETINQIRRRTYIDRADINSDPYLLNLQNGIYNLESGELTPHTPEQILLSQLPVAYNPDARCEHWDHFLEEILPDERDRRVIMEMFGHTLIRTYDYQYWYMLTGGGANGKGTLMAVLRTLLGTKNVSAVELHDMENVFATAQMYKKLANIAGDLPSRYIKETGMLKKLTGGDMIHAQFKNQPIFEFINHATLIFSANEVPASYDKTESF